MLSKQFQEDMPLQMYVYPINPDAALPDAFLKYAQAPEQPAVLAPDVIAAKRDEWIRAWSDIFAK